MQKYNFQFLSHKDSKNRVYDKITERKNYSILLLGFVLIWFANHLKEKLCGYFIGLLVALQMIATICALIVVALVSQSALQPFIYFRF